LAVILVAAFMDLLDAGIVFLALPHIQQDLHASYTALQWVAAGYTLAFALVLITAGRLGDMLGRKRLFLVGWPASPSPPGCAPPPRAQPC
jgi:MFS family permease